MHMKNKQTRKRGIALVVVLGLLALLLMMAVAFSIFMRTERHAAGSYQHDVRARLLLQAAEAKALEALELDANLGDDYYPDWVVLYSQGGSVTNTLTTNQVWATHLPDALLTDPALLAALNKVSWLPVAGGWVGYLIVNASGLLDANKAGGGTRGTGVDPSEIDLTGLGNGEVSDPALLADGRDYESVAELKKGLPNHGLKSVGHFVTYSRSPTNNVITDPLDISGDDLLPERGAIIGKLRDEFGFTAFDAADVADALIDYVDADSIPKRLDAPCMERVPMINEILLEPKWVPARPPRPGTLDLTPQIEVFYPFVYSRGSAKFTLEGTITYVCDQLSFDPPGKTKSDFPLPGENGKCSFTSEPKGLELSYNHLLFPPLPTASVAVDTSVWAGVTAYFKVTVSLTLKDDAGKPVDSVENLDVTMGRPSAPPPYAWLPSVRIPGPGEVAVVKRSGVECVDPRFNHLTGQGVAWYSYAMLEAPPGHRGGEGFPAYPDHGTLGALNRLTERWLAKQMATQNYSTDGHPFMHVADAKLISPGELSYLPRGGNQKHNFWNTLRLIDSGTNVMEKADPIYQYFTVTPDNPTQRGFVNPNTDSPEALQALFMNMPIDRYPGDDSVGHVTQAQAVRLATAWLNDTNWPDGGYTSRADLCANQSYLAEAAKVANEVSMAFPASVSQATAFRKEAAIRNLLGLVNPRQNYFLIALFAQSTAKVRLPRKGDVLGEEIESVQGDSSALLEVWRDPMPVTGGAVTNRPMFRRRFEILSEE